MFRWIYKNMVVKKMLITLKLKKPEGVRKKDVYEKIALMVNKQLQKKQLNGELGVGHPISKEHIEFWIEEYCIKNKYLSIADKTRRDYWLFLERLYKSIMTDYIRKDELTKDDDDGYKTNIYYYPGLVYINGVGYIITNSKELIKKYENQRNDTLEGQKLHLDQKCYDAEVFVKQLPSNQKELLNSKVDVT